MPHTRDVKCPTRDVCSTVPFLSKMRARPARQNLRLGSSWPGPTLDIDWCRLVSGLPAGAWRGAMRGALWRGSHRCNKNRSGAGALARAVVSDAVLGSGSGVSGGGSVPLEARVERAASTLQVSKKIHYQQVRAPRQGRDMAVARLKSGRDGGPGALHCSSNHVIGPRYRLKRSDRAAKHIERILCCTVPYVG